MFKTCFASALAAVAFAEGPQMIEAVPNTPTTPLVISQIDTLGNFTFNARTSAASPDPVQKAHEESFHIEGIWNKNGETLKTVDFTCYMLGAKVYDESYDCSASGSNDHGTCTIPSGTAGEMWTGDFGFDVPAVTPNFEYDVHVIGKDASGATLFELESKFYI